MKHTIMIVLLAASFCKTCLADDQKKSSLDSTSAAERIELLDAVAGLQANPWTSWPVGTRLVVGYADRTQQYPKIKHYVQPNMTYEVTGDGTTFGRGQTPGGKVLTQHFKVANEAGLPLAPKLTGQKAKQAQLSLGGIGIECDKTQFTIEHFPGPMVTTTYWASHDRPELLLKRKTSNGNYWQVEGGATRMIGTEKYQCVKTRQRMATVDGFVITIEHLNSSVPGHLVERVKEFHSKNSTTEHPILTMVTREYALLVDIPKLGTEQSPGGDSLKAAPQE